MNDVIIYLTAEDAEKFKMFQKHYDLFTQLDSNRALDLQFGKVTLNFAFGELQNIVQEKMVYRK